MLVLSVSVLVVAVPHVPEFGPAMLVAVSLGLLAAAVGLALGAVAIFSRRGRTRQEPHRPSPL